MLRYVASLCRLLTRDSILEKQKHKFREIQSPAIVSVQLSDSEETDSTCAITQLICDFETLRRIAIAV